MKKTKYKEPNSVQKVVFFGLFVCILICISLGTKLFFLIKSSTFDGNHRYTIAIKKNEKEARIISIDPTEKKKSSVYIKAKESLPRLDFLLGIPIDATVNHDVKEDATIDSDLASLLFNIHVNGYDMIRLMTISKTIPQEDSSSVSLTYPVSLGEVDSKTQELFLDSGIASDNKTVSITNATNTAGLGSQLERVLEKAGGTVLAVTSSPHLTEQTSLVYYGEESYTVQKLERMLQVDGEAKEGKNISDIVITLGLDQVKERK